MKVTALNEAATLFAHRTEGGSTNPNLSTGSAKQSFAMEMLPFLQLVDIYNMLIPFPCEHLKHLTKSYVDVLSVDLNQKLKRFGEAMVEKSDLLQCL